MHSLWISKSDPVLAVRKAYVGIIDAAADVSAGHRGVRNDFKSNRHRQYHSLSDALGCLRSHRRFDIYFSELRGAGLRSEHGVAFTLSCGPGTGRPEHAAARPSSRC